MKILAVRSVIFLVCIAAMASILLPRLQAQESSRGSSSAKQPDMIELRDAVARFNNRDIEGTLAKLEEAKKKDADLPPAEVMLADFFRQSNSIQGYVAWLEKAANKYPEDPEAFVRLAELALMGGQVTAGDLVLQKASAMLPKFTSSKKRKESIAPRIPSGLASVAESREDWPLAQKYLEEWLKSEPKNDRALVRLARALFKQKKPTESYAKLKEAKTANPKVLAPEAQLAAFYWDFGDKKNAKQWTDQALRAWPNESETWRFAAGISVEMEQFKEAEERAAKAYELDSAALESKLLRGTVALFKKDYVNAEKYYQAAHLQQPEVFAASNNLALALAEQKDESKKRRALGYAKNNLEQYQNTRNAGEAASTLGRVLYNMGNKSEAQRALEAALKQQNFEPDTLYYYAVVLNDQGSKEQAKKFLESALKSTRPFTMKPEAKLLYEQLTH
ncbi:MAG: tetratricopeptide repeat protein [Pirellulales bacterium]|nr:tetratricopeptide repeat protein [Pirellulales bacterium]